MFRLRPPPVPSVPRCPVNNIFMSCPERSQYGNTREAPEQEFFNIDRSKSPRPPLEKGGCGAVLLPPRPPFQKGGPGGILECLDISDQVLGIRSSGAESRWHGPVCHGRFARQPIRGGSCLEPREKISLNGNVKALIEAALSAGGHGHIPMAPAGWSLQVDGGPEHTVLPRQVGGVVAIPLSDDHGMTYSVHVGCDHEEPKNPINAHRGAEIAVVEDRGGSGATIVDRWPGGRSQCRHSDDFECHGADEVNGLEAKADGQLIIDIRVVHPMCKRRRAKTAGWSTC